MYGRRHFCLLCRAKIENPGRFAMWFRQTSGALAAALAITAFALLAAAGARAQSASDVFTVRGVAVDETAGPAAAARQSAMAAEIGRLACRGRVCQYV